MLTRLEIVGILQEALDAIDGGPEAWNAWIMANRPWTFWMTNNGAGHDDW